MAKGDNINCLSIGVPSPECTLQNTIYGYYPSVAANAIFCVIFGLCMVVQLFQGIKYKSWAFMVAMSIGSLGEMIGYIGRILLNNNPYDGTGFEIQICCLIIAPAFYSAGIYLTLKHFVLTMGSDFSRIPARWYTWIFIGFDFLSLVLQGAGGGIAATAKTDSNQKLGNNMMMAGIVWQVFTLAIFGIMSAEYAGHVFKGRNQMTQTGAKLLQDRKFKLFIGAILLAFLAIFTRCNYRIAEMAGGWKNPIMQNERDFIVLDGVMNSIAVISLTIFHPGYCFPQMQMRNKNIIGANGDFQMSSPGNKQVSDIESDTQPADADAEPTPRRKGLGRFGRGAAK